MTTDIKSLIERSDKIIDNWQAKILDPDFNINLVIELRNALSEQSQGWQDVADAIVVLLFNAQPSARALHSHVPNRCIRNLADALAALNLPAPPTTGEV